MLDWLIVGGGFQGTYLSLFLTRRRGVLPDRLRVLDPHPAPLALWQTFTRNVGMTHLRSSHAHSLHYDPFSLITFSRTAAGAPHADFIAPYGRPSLALFNAHCDMLIARHGLAAQRLLGRAHALRRLPDGWAVETDQGCIAARRVVLALGSTERPHWPEWAAAVRSAAPERIAHVFDPAFDREALPDWREAVVVGGGITAAQIALALAERAPGTVTLLMRHALRVHDFDADVSWITGAALDGFLAEPDATQRRALITAARHRGSLPGDVAALLAAAERVGALARREGEVVGATAEAEGIRAQLAGGASLWADQVLLATGFAPGRPGGAWLAAAIAEHGLPVAADGFPLADEGLCWAPGLHVVGPLAELAVGPVARNFAGIRLAAERLPGS